MSNNRHQKHKKVCIFYKKKKIKKTHCVSTLESLWNIQNALLKIRICNITHTKIMLCVFSFSFHQFSNIFFSFYIFLWRSSFSVIKIEQDFCEDFHLWLISSGGSEQNCPMMFKCCPFSWTEKKRKTNTHTLTNKQTNTLTGIRVFLLLPIFKFGCLVDGLEHRCLPAESFCLDLWRVLGFTLLEQKHTQRYTKNDSIYTHIQVYYCQVMTRNFIIFKNVKKEKHIVWGKQVLFI